eukprot:snap_masked-scaffold_78-processed-gene-0.45-mRNA-1 protein AED:1.00 eAED:1.00 QI:0/-1/0/0/-1/1/1/0/1077
MKILLIFCLLRRILSLTIEQDVENVLNCYSDSYSNYLEYGARKGAVSPKIFVYPLKEAFSLHQLSAKRQIDPWERMYLSEHAFYCNLFNSAHLSTFEEAEYFFIPVLATFFMHSFKPDVGLAGGFDLVHRAIAAVKENFNIKNWEEHVILVSHDLGGCLVHEDYNEIHILQPFLREELIDIELLQLDPGVKMHRNLSHRLRQPCFRGDKDLTLFPFIGSKEYLQSITLARTRPNVAYFRGTVQPKEDKKSYVYSTGVRQELFMQKSDLKKAGVKIFGVSLPLYQEYLFELSQSKFCLSPPGWVSWSPRFYQAIYAGCIPVVFEPNSSLHISELESELSVVVSEWNLKNSLSTFLHQISSNEVSFYMQKALIWRENFVFTTRKNLNTQTAFTFILQQLSSMWRLGSKMNPAKLIWSQSLQKKCGEKLYPRLYTTWVNDKVAAELMLREEIKSRQRKILFFRKLEFFRYLEKIPSHPEFVLLSNCSIEFSIQGNRVLLGEAIFNPTEKKDLDAMSKVVLQKLISTWTVTNIPLDYSGAQDLLSGINNQLGIGSQVKFGKWSGPPVEHPDYCRRNEDEETAFLLVPQSIHQHNSYCTSYQMTSLLSELKVINLDRRPDKWKKTQKILRNIQNNVNGLSVERFSAMDGSSVQPTTKLDIYLTLSTADYSSRINFEYNPYEDHGNRAGVIGCLLSHLTIYNMLSQSTIYGFYDYILVLEDDVVLKPQFPDALTTLTKIIQQDYSWDLIYLGFSDDNNELYRNNFVRQIREGLNLYEMATGGRSHGGGTFAYIIRKSGAIKLIQYLQNSFLRKSGKLTQPIDWILIEALQQNIIRAYKTYPHIITSTPIQTTDSDTHELYRLDRLTLFCKYAQRQISSPATRVRLNFVTSVTAEQYILIVPKLSQNYISLLDQNYGSCIKKCVSLVDYYGRENQTLCKYLNSKERFRFKASELYFFANLMQLTELKVKLTFQNEVLAESQLLNLAELVNQYIFSFGIEVKEPHREIFVHGMGPTSTVICFITNVKKTSTTECMSLSFTMKTFKIRKVILQTIQVYDFLGFLVYSKDVFIQIKYPRRNWKVYNL